MGGGGAIYLSALFGFNASLIFVSGLLALSLLFVILFIRDPAVGSRVQIHAERRFARFIGTLRRFARARALVAQAREHAQFEADEALALAVEETRDARRR